MNILFRVDSYQEIAVGHLARCIKLGKALAELGNQITFISYDDSETKARLEEAGFKYQLIPYKINDTSFIDEELENLAKYSAEINVMIVDSYMVSDKYFDEINELFPFTVYLDDLGLDFNVDMVVNSSCKAKINDYVAPVALCGTDYVILEYEYELGRSLSKLDKHNSILITMGGVDHYDLSSSLIPLIENINNNIKLNIVIGPYYDNIDEIKLAASKSRLKINIFQGLSNISSVILQCDIAITAGGTAVYELAAMSTPSIGIALWNNQKANIECLSKKGATLPLFYSEKKEFESLLISSLKKLILDNKLREKMSIAAREAVDGKGARRISNKINQEYGR